MQISEMVMRLERAQAEIRLVEEQLSDKAHACPTCGLTVRHDYTQYQKRVELVAARNKLQRLVGSLHGIARMGAPDVVTTVPFVGE